jgi:hypothetical protein
MRLFGSILSAAGLCVGITYLSIAHTVVPNASGLDSKGPTGMILAKLGSPSRQTMATFIEAGMTEVRVHHLTTDETTELKAAISSLPPLYQTVLARHLHVLSFVDGIPGAGTGLTGPATGTDHLYDMTFRASVLRETLTQFLTTKEQQCFSSDGSNYHVTFDGGEMDAFTYVLIHEATHVTSFSLNLIPDKRDPFGVGIWTAYQELAPPYKNTILDRNVFRKNGRPFKLGDAVQVYEALARTPFVDLYATASAQEDLAELVALHETWTRFHDSLKVEVRDGAGHILYQYEPAKSPMVQSRFSLIDDLLATKI